MVNEVMGEGGAMHRHVLLSRAGAAAPLTGVPWAFELHMVIAMSAFTVLPFMRLVHVSSVPTAHVFRRQHQLVRS